MTFSTVKHWLAAGLMALSFSASANLAGDNLPSVKNLGALLGSKKVAQVSTPASDVQIGTSLKATESARGTLAKEVAAMLAAEVKDYDQAYFIQTVEDTRKNIEVALKDNHFALQDLGVAYGVSFVMLWEVAHDKTLPVEASAKVIKQMVGIFDKINDEYEKQPQQAKDIFYDQLFTAPIVMLLLKEGYKHNQQLDGVAEVKAAAANLFRKITSMSHTDIILSDKGEIQGFASQASAAQSTASESGTDW
tara:strand:+ start:976 stop:1722 length:747 start_codon:yes stop_codon:yes gene_type:complete